MTTPTPKNNISRTAKGFVGAGIGIIICWVVVNYYPHLVGQWALTDWGKVTLLVVQAILFMGTIGAIISISSIFAQNSKGFKISEIKYKGVEVKFNNNGDTPDVKISDENDG